MAKDPAFLFMSKDWIEGTAEFMPDEKGVFIDLMCHQHQKGDLPSDTVRLARMVGLEHQEFLRIWKVVGTKFKQIGERLVNRKLSEIMTERSEKGWKNTISGTFASLLRLGNFAPEQYKLLRKNFKVEDFFDSDKQILTERLTEWIEGCLKSIGNANAIGNVNEDSLEKEVQEEKPFEPTEPIPSVSQNEKPTLDEAKAYFVQIKSTEEEGELFFHHYEAQGWKNGNHMWITNWRSQAMKWLLKGPEHQQGSKNGTEVQQNGHKPPKQGKVVTLLAQNEKLKKLIDEQHGQ
jgi:hypothetical protein